MAYALDEGQRARAFAEIALNDREAQMVRLLVISQMELLPPSRQKGVSKTFRRLEKAKDPAVAKAASSALAKLAVDAK